MLSSAIYNKSPGIRNFRARKSDLRSRGNLGRSSRAQTSPSCSRDASTDPPVREQGLPAHETALADPPVSKPGLPAHETALAGHPVSRLGLPAHETTLADPPVRRTGLSAHEEGVRKYVVRRMIDN